METARRYWLAADIVYAFLAVIIGAGAAALLTLGGCATPAPPPPAPPPSTSIPLCQDMPDPATAGVCANRFTREGHGYPCVRCWREGCLHDKSKSYCVNGDCMDPACAPGISGALEPAGLPSFQGTEAALCRAPGCGRAWAQGLPDPRLLPAPRNL